MIKILRYLLALLIILLVTYIFRKNKLKLRILKAIAVIIVSLTLVIMPFENLFLQFDSPEDAFRYAVNSTIIRTVENKNTALVIHGDESAIKTALIVHYGEKWKNPFMPVRQKVLFAEECMPNLYEVSTPVLITYEPKSNNAYILVSPPYDAEISDNMESVFEKFSISNIRTHFVAYVENLNKNYILNINGTNYPILQKVSRT